MRVNTNRYTLPVLLGLITLSIVLSLFKFIPAKSLVWVLGGIELTALLLVLFQLSKVVQSYRNLKSEGFNGLDAFQGALEVVFPPVAAKLAVMELRLYYSLYQSFKTGAPVKEGEVFNSRLDTYGFFIKAISFVAVLETLIIEIALPERWWKWKLLFLGLNIWAFVWLFADYRAMKKYSHLLKPQGVLFQMGQRCCGEIPWEQIQTVKKCSKGVPVFKMGPVIPKDEPGIFYLAAGENCNTVIDFKSEQTFRRSFRDFTGVTRVYLSLEQPDGFIRQASRYIE